MSVVKRKVYVTFPAEKVREAVICEMYDKYRVRFNIRSASVNEMVGLIALELEGSEDKVQAAIDYFKSRGLTVEPIELNIMTG